jgi:hypothetical protein
MIDRKLYFSCFNYFTTTIYNVILRGCQSCKNIKISAFVNGKSPIRPAPRLQDGNIAAGRG